MPDVLNLKKQPPRQTPPPLHPTREVKKPNTHPVHQSAPTPSVIKTITKPLEKKDHAIAWTAELQQVIRRPRMLWLILIVLGGASLLAFFQSSILLFVLIGLTFLITIFQRTQKPRPSTISINDAGIRIDDKTKFWKDMSSFWIEYNPGGLKELSIELRQWHLPYIKIPLVDTDPMKVRNHLILYIPEKEHELSAVDAFLKGK